MSFTIGSALTIIASLFGLAFSAWAVLIGSALIFRKKAEISYSLIRHAPFRSMFIGGAVSFLSVIVSLVLLGLPLALARVMGYAGVLVIMTFASIGASGLVLLVSDRLREFDARLRPFASLNRASLLIVSSGLVPLLGIFVIFPAVISLGVGTAIQALFMREALSVATSVGEM